MATGAQAVLGPGPLDHREPGWIYRKWWDLSLIIFSAVLVPMPLMFAWGAQKSGWMSQQQAIDIVNIAVAALIGGPHLFSTFTFTFLNRSFLRRHPVYAGSSLFLPLIVIYLGVYHYVLLINFFFAWASIHVLHQIIYISDCYRAQANARDPWWSRGLDYAVILTGLYPIGLYKLSKGEFHVGGVILPYPEALRPLPLAALVGAVFGSLMIAWIVKTVVEHRHGHMSVAKTLLISVTSVVSFFLPMGSNLDVLFQGYNTWHSFQYLFLFWLINRLRYFRGEIESPLVRSIVRSPSILPYYLSFLGATGVLVLLTLIVRSVSTLSAEQSYFIVVLSTLLMHYYFDHFLFTQTELVR